MGSSVLTKQNTYARFPSTRLSISTSLNLDLRINVISNKAEKKKKKRKLEQISQALPVDMRSPVYPAEQLLFNPEITLKKI